MEQTGHSVRILRCNRHGDWVELRKEAVAQVTASGLVVRENVSNSLLADFPFSSVQKLEKITNTMITVNTLSDKTAFLFPNCSGATNFYVDCASLKWPIQDCTLQKGQDDQFHIPQLENPAVQEFVVKLLFSDEFKLFVLDLKGLLNGMNQQFTK